MTEVKFWIGVGFIVTFIGMCFVGSVRREISYNVSAPYISIDTSPTSRSGGIPTPDYELNYITSSKIGINLTIKRTNTMIDASVKKAFVSYYIWESWLPAWCLVDHYTWGESAVLPRDAFKRQDEIITKSVGGVQIR